MLLVAGPMPELLRFLQILSWIILPLLAASAGLTIFFHFRNQRKKTPKVLDDANADRLAFKNEEGNMIYFDHSPLIRQYKKQLSSAGAKLSAMEKDLKNLSEKYSATARYARILFLTHKPINMEISNGQMSPKLQEEIEKVAAETASEKQAMQQKILQLEHSLARTVNTNKSLTDQLNLSHASDDEKLHALHQANEEVADLKERLMNMEYLEEVLEEKKSQINFLQDQLENKVRALHQSEQQRASISRELDRLRKENLALLDRTDLLSSQADTASQFETLSLNLRSELAEREQLLAAGAGEISYLQSQISELNNQHELTAAALADSADRESRLQDQFTQEQSKSSHLHHKLQVSNTLLRRIQREIMQAIPENENSSPVIQIDRVVERPKNDLSNNELVPAL